MVIGQCTTDPVTGAVGRAYTALLDNPRCGFTPAAFVENSQARNILAAVLDAVVRSVIQEIQENGTITIDQGGLQTDPDTFVSTNAPSSPVELTGKIS